MTDFNNLILLNRLREKGVAVVRTPGGIIAHGLWRLSQTEQQMFYRLTQKELSDALRMQKA
jgi:hypothetical protein